MVNLNRRALLQAGLAVTAISALAACSSDGSDGRSSTDSESNDLASTPITVWVDSDREATVLSAADLFKEKEAVEVRVEVKDFSRIVDDFISQASSGRGPDAIICPSDAIGQMVSADLISPIELGDAKSTFQEVAVNAFTYDGKVYGVPVSTENIALIRNRELVADPVDSWAELISEGNEVVSAGMAKYTFLVGLDPESSNPQRLYPFQVSFGAPIFKLGEDGSYDAENLTMGGINGAKFVGWLNEQAESGVLNLNISDEIAKEQFIRGQAPYFLTGPWNLAAFKDAEIDYAIDSIPKPGDQDATPFVDVQGFVVATDSENPAATQKFLVDYLGSTEVQSEMFATLGRIPANLEALDEAKSDPDIAAFSEVGAHGVPVPNVPVMQQVWPEWGAAQVEILSGADDSVAIWQSACNSIQEIIDEHQ